MVTENNKYQSNIDKLYELVETTKDEEEKNLYAYKLFILLSYLNKHDEALEISKNITDDRIDKTATLEQMANDGEYDLIVENPSVIHGLYVDAVDDHYKYLVVYIKAMHFYNTGEFVTSAGLLFEVINGCNVDDILVEIAIIDFINASKKCENRDIFYDFYTSYYKNSKSILPPKLVKLIENAKNNNIDDIIFTFEEVIGLYTASDNMNVPFKRYFYGASKELEKLIDFDAAHLLIIDNDNIDAFEYNGTRVYEKFYTLEKIKNSIYNTVIETKKPIIKRLDEKLEANFDILFENKDEIYDSFLLLPLINEGKVIGVFGIFSNVVDINDTRILVERYSEALKIRVVNNIKNYVARFNEQIVEALDKLVDGYLFEQDGTVTLSPGAKKVFEIYEERLSINDLFTEVDLASANRIKELLSKEIGRTTIEIVTNDNRTFEIETDAITLEGRGKVRIGLIKELTSTKTKLYHYENLAYTDTLTKLNNYNSLMEAYSKIPEDEETTFINFDLNKFKQINDTYGHNIGDVALQFFANALKNTFGKLKGQIFRKSGDEFIVILDKNVVREEKIAALEELSKYLNDEEHYPSDLPIKISYSAGIASTRATRKGKEKLFKFADLAMYEAKLNTKESSYVIFDEAHLADYKQDMIITEYIKDAIINNTITINFDEIKTTDELIHGYKVSYGIPELGLYNDKLAIFADKNDLLYSLAENLSKKVFAKKAEMVDVNDDSIIIHIPMVADLMTTDAFYNFILKEMEVNYVNPKTITISLIGLTKATDITETADRLNKYVKLGFAISFDFMHTDFPNTNYLDLLDFKYYNVSSKLIDVLDEKNTDKKVIHYRHILKALKELGVEAIVEGIHLDEVRELLIENGIKYYCEPAK